MAESKETPAKAEPEKASASTKAMPPPDPEKGAARKTKLVAETGRYVCKQPVVYSTPDGRRASARVGDVVSMHEGDP